MNDERPPLRNEFRILSTFEKGSLRKYPDPYDLVLLLLEDGRVIPGWYMRLEQFGGYRVRPEMNIIGWKRIKDY